MLQDSGLIWRGCKVNELGLFWGYAFRIGNRVILPPNLVVHDFPSTVSTCFSVQKTPSFCNARKFGIIYTGGHHWAPLGPILR